MFVRLKTYLILAGGLFLFSCAQQGSPSGGPKDLDPPEVLESNPDNYSTNFLDKKISITFDEYLDMGNFTQELVVSPPMEEKPEVRLKSKTLIIDFEEELKKDVTYTFNFGDGIKDLNEKNILQNYEYVFSTGDYLDSLSIKGRLRNASDLSIPEGQISVMLYNELNDSLPLKEIPYYIGRGDVEGNYAVNNLRPDVYKLFVLKDGNNNFLFDAQTEEIAFLDSSLVLNANYIQQILLESGKYDSTDLLPDTLTFYQDTVGMSPDSIEFFLDSIEALQPDWNTIYIDLLLFTEEDQNQYISEYARDDRRKMEILFNRPLSDSFIIEPVFPPDLSTQDLILEFGKNRDSLVIWPADTLVAAMDTIGLSLKYTVLDSLNNFVMRPDTISFVYRESTKNDKDEKKEEDLTVSTIKNNGRQHLHQGLRMDINEPLEEIDPDKILLFEIPDTIDIPLSIKPYIDSSHLRRSRLDVKWKENMQYRLVMYPGAFSTCIWQHERHS